MQMRKKIGYALGDMGISISYLAVGFFFKAYLTNIVGMDPLFAGLAFGIIPGLFFVLTALVLQRYQVTRRVHQQVRADLDQRAAQTGADRVAG